jgi:hypothetical protein
MGQRNGKLRRGDFVEAKTPDEIVQTLDAEGASDHLPFMPEMLEFYGRRFRVPRRALTLCFSGPGSSRGFRIDNVVTLDDVRCSGTAHDGCQKMVPNINFLTVASCVSAQGQRMNEVQLSNAQRRIQRALQMVLMRSRARTQPSWCSASRRNWRAKAKDYALCLRYSSARFAGRATMDKLKVTFLAVTLSFPTESCKTTL